MAWLPIRLGLFYDFPQGDGLFADALRLGLDEVAASGRLDREFEFVAATRAGCPSGSEHDIKRGLRRARSGGASRSSARRSPTTRSSRRPCATRHGSRRSTTPAGNAHVAMDVPLPGGFTRGGTAAARPRAWSSAACGARPSSSTSRPSAAGTPSASKPRAPGSVSRSPAPRASRRWPRTPATCSRASAAGARCARVLRPRRRRHARSRSLGSTSGGTSRCSRTRRSCSATRGPTGVTATRAGSTSTPSPTTISGARR